VRDDVLKHRELMISGSLDRAVLHLGVPAAAAALLQAGFLVVDAFWLGRVGAVALAAASTAGFVMWLAQTLGEGMAAGSGAVLASAVGAGDRAAAKRAAVAGQTLALSGSLIVLGVGVTTSRWVFQFMETANPVTTAGLTYLWTVLLGMPAYFMFAWMSAAFRAVGAADTALRLLALAAVVNAVLDPLLIFGVGPLPRLEVAGAALATVSSWVVACARGWWLLGQIGIRPRIRDVLRPPAESWRAIGIGLPLALEGALFSVIYIVLTRLTTSFGTAAVAALGVGHKLEVLNYFVCAGMGAAATTLVGQNLGARNRTRAIRAAWRTLFLTALPVGVVTVLLVTFPDTAIAVFISDDEVVAAGMTYVLLVGMTQLFMASEVVLLGAFAGAHWTAVPAILEICLTAARVPLAFWLVHLGWGVEGVWLSIAITTVVKGSVLAVLFAVRGGSHAGHGGMPYNDSTQGEVVHDRQDSTAAR
jgi:putative MATE family efflux protein